MALKIKWDQVRDFVIFEGVKRLADTVPPDCDVNEDKVKISNLTSHLTDNSFFERLGLSKGDLAQAMAFKNMAMIFIRQTSEDKDLTINDRLNKLFNSLHWKEDLLFFVVGLIFHQAVKYFS